MAVACVVKMKGARSSQYWEVSACILEVKFTPAPSDRSGQNTYVCTWVASLCCSTGHPPDTQQWLADWHPA